MYNYYINVMDYIALYVCVNTFLSFHCGLCWLGSKWFKMEDVTVFICLVIYFVHILHYTEFNDLIVVLLQLLCVWT